MKGECQGLQTSRARTNAVVPSGKSTKPSKRLGWRWRLAQLSSPWVPGVPQRSPGQVPSLGALCPYPTICHLWGRMPPAGGQVARRLLEPLFGGRQPAALPDWAFCGAQNLRKTVVLWAAPGFGRLVGTATPLREHRRPEQCFAPQLTYPGSSDQALAPVASDPAVDRPCSRLVRPQGPRPSTAAWRASLRKSHAVGCCWWHAHMWTATSTAGRFQRLEGWGKDHPARKYVPNARSRKRAATPCSSGQRCWCTSRYPLADPLNVKALGIHGWSLTRDHHAGMGADHSVSRCSRRAGPCEEV